LYSNHLRKPRANNQITANEVRVISEEGKNLGVFSKEKALQYSKERNLDLIEISQNSNPPVCRVVDFGKYLYHLEKKEKTKRKGLKIGKLKNIRISLRISEHDLETKTKQTKKFLSKGYKVRIEAFLKGREKSLSNFAKEKMEKMLKKIEEEIPLKRESDIKKNPRGMEIIIAKK
jgi:translation initiation factor IF-3